MSGSTKLPEEKLETLLSKSEIPIIDLAHCGTDDVPLKSVTNRVALQLQKAFTEKGLVFIVNHGISEEKLKTAWSYLDDFCELPTDVKEIYIRTPDDNQGYVKPGQERFDGKTPELRHAFNICTLSAAAKLPEEPLPGFRDHISDLAKDFKQLSLFLLQALATSLGLNSHYFIDKHRNMLSGNHDNETTLRLLYYPPIVEDDNKNELTKGRCKYSYQKCTMDQLDLETDDNNDDSEASNDIGTNGNATNITRCGAHKDYGTFTLLAQDSEGGLEAKLPGSEKWKRVGHLPGAILMNTGEILSIWTQEQYPALNHRVIIPEQTSIRSNGRHSMAFFCHPDNDEPIEPIECPIVEQADIEKKSRNKSFKTAKNKVYTAYQIIQKRFKQTYAS